MEILRGFKSVLGAQNEDAAQTGSDTVRLLFFHCKNLPLDYLLNYKQSLLIIEIEMEKWMQVCASSGSELTSVIFDFKSRAGHYTLRIICRFIANVSVSCIKFWRTESSF